jgi:hypothetical protein
MSFTAAFALLVPLVCRAPLPATDTIPACGSAISLSMIATDANREHCTAIRGVTTLQAKHWLRPGGCASHEGIMPQEHRIVAPMTGRMIRAFGADDVARLRLVFKKLRFQMIADTEHRGGDPSRS